jgi:transposase-like protein
LPLDDHTGIGLTGLPDAIGVVWPQATVQLCVVHLVRNSLRYASKAHWQKITAELRTIYTAKTVAAAQERFAEFAESWRDRYPAMIGMWERAWTEFVPLLNFPVEIRKLIYTTDEIVNSDGLTWTAPLRPAAAA